MFYLKNNKFLINSQTIAYLENIVKSKLFNNGYIFYGPEGVGKKDTAIQFAKKIFKEYSLSKNIEEKVSNNNHPDLLIIKPTSFVKIKKKISSSTEVSKSNHSEIIKIEQIRNIKTFLSQKSIESEKKIVLIYQAHLLNEAASNCLLKTLEEPKNGILILLTTKLDFLLDTIKSRCQLIRFKSLSNEQIKEFLKDNLETSNHEINKILNFQDLINSSNGSPKNVLENIDIWNTISDEIKDKVTSPIKDSIEILEVSKLISLELEPYQQILLLNLIQKKWWAETQNINLVKRLETLKNYVKDNVQPRLAWEVTLLKIANEIL